MLGWLLFGTLLLVLVLIGARAFARASPARLATFFKAFIAGFSALASTGLIFAGRFGLAIITVGAMIMAIRALRNAPAGGQAGPSGHGSTVETGTLRMELDHATGELEGEVLRGALAGRSLASLGLSDLLGLLADCQREDPRSVPLLETYLDRRQSDWRDHVGRGDESAGGHAAGETMDDATAFRVLGLTPGASKDEIKAAHRRLMIRLHPDHGGTDYLAAQLNRAKDQLLRGEG
jgi:hypothetical protein